MDGFPHFLNVLVHIIFTYFINLDKMDVFFFKFTNKNYNRSLT